MLVFIRNIFHDVYRPHDLQNTCWPVLSTAYWRYSWLHHLSRILLDLTLNLFTQVSRKYQALTEPLTACFVSDGDLLYTSYRWWIFYSTWFFIFKSIWFIMISWLILLICGGCDGHVGVRGTETLCLTQLTVLWTSDQHRGTCLSRSLLILSTL